MTFNDQIAVITKMSREEINSGLNEIEIVLNQSYTSLDTCAGASLNMY